MKENLYSDLTGLIIRNVKRKDGEDEFDCLQTGRNGSKYIDIGSRRFEMDQSLTHTFQLSTSTLLLPTTVAHLPRRPHQASLTKRLSSLTSLFSTRVGTASSWTFCRIT